MSQDQNKNDNKRFPKFNPRGANNGEDNTPKKGPRFSIYWVYAIIFAVLIGIQLISPFSGSTVSINQNQFEEMLKAGDVAKYTVVSNRNLVRVTIKKDAIPKYAGTLDKNLSATDAGPHASFKIPSVESFMDDKRLYETQNPEVKNVAWDSEAETNFWSPILQTLLPILIFIGLWILLMRKMGGGAGAGGGPGGIFNIGKSKATLFDKGTKVNITFADVAGLDEAKVEVMEIVDFLRNPKKYTALGGKIPKGALLVGPRELVKPCWQKQWLVKPRCHSSV